MSAEFTLTGTENLQRIFSEFPERGYRQPINKAFKKAAVPVKKAIQSNMPSSLSALKKQVKIKSAGKSKEPMCFTGFFWGGNMLYRNRRGQTWNPYSLAYWHNYGTLANRDPQHAFSNVRKKITATRRGGIKPTRFMEKGWDQSRSKAEKIFEEEVNKEILKFFEQEAAK